MLTDRLRRPRYDPALVLIVLAGGLVGGVLIGLLFDRGNGSGGARASTAATPRQPRLRAPAGAVRTGSQNRTELQRALNYGVEKADALGGEAAAAVWVGGDASPVLSGPTTVPHRMWSMSKAVVTLAALKAAHDEPDRILGSAMTNAIRRSDNCAIRRVIVGLQDRLDEGVAGTVAAFEHILAAAGASLARTPSAAGAEQACFRYLEGNRGGLPGGDLGVVPQFGTAEWTEKGAILFTHALSEGVYGASGAYLLALMGLPKQPPLEEPPPPSAPPLDWGAGEAFPAIWQPAWKAGWGGSQDDPPHFLAGQIVVLRLAGVPVAAAAIFVPRTEPPTDNPGITQAPQALELMFGAARIGLEQEHVGGVR